MTHQYDPEPKPDDDPPEVPEDDWGWGPLLPGGRP